MASKLLDCLATFTSEEWSAFRKYMLSRTGEDTDNFQIFQFVYIRKNRFHVLEDVDIIRKKYFSKFTPKGFSNALSRIHLWLEEWMVIEEVNSIKYEKELLLVKAMNKRGLYDQADKTARKIIKDLNSQNPPHAYESNIKARLFHYQYFSDNPIKYRKGKGFITDLINHYLDEFLEQGLLYQGELISWQNIKGGDFSGLISKIDVMCNHIPESEISVLYKLHINLIREEGLDTFIKLWQAIKKGRIDTYSEAHAIIVFNLINKCQRLWAKGEFVDPNQCIEVFNYGLSSGVLLQAGKIPVIRFHNIVSSIGLLHDFMGANQFIDKWYKLVDTNHPESTKSLALAQNAFYNRQYNEILPLLRGIDYENPIQKGRALSLESIGHYYDRKEVEEIFYLHLNNYQRWLRRNKSKVGEVALKYQLNLIKVIESLAKHDYKEVDLDISKYQYILYRQWVVDEIDRKKRGGRN